MKNMTLGKAYCPCIDAQTFRDRETERESNQRINNSLKFSIICYKSGFPKPNEEHIEATVA